MTDPRALISRIADELDHYQRLQMDDCRAVHPLAEEARAALARWGRAAPAGPEPERGMIPAGYIHRQGNHWELSERPLLDDEIGRGWTQEPVYRAVLKITHLESD